MAGWRGCPGGRAWAGGSAGVRRIGTLPRRWGGPEAPSVAGDAAILARAWRNSAVRPAVFRNAPGNGEQGLTGRGVGHTSRPAAAVVGLDGGLVVH